MKNFSVLAFSAYLMLASYDVCAMKAPTLAIHTNNKKQMDANKAPFLNAAGQVQNHHYMNVAVMQPTPLYKTLNTCVDEAIAKGGFGPYGKVPAAQWHISLIVFHVPLNAAPTKADAQKAVDDLYTIVKGFRSKLKGITYTFDDIRSIGSHQWLAAHYSFMDKKQQGRFTKSYGYIIDSYLKKCPTCWMEYGYRSIPHISVGSVGKASQPKAQFICKTNSPVKKIELLYRAPQTKNRKQIFISTRYFDQNTGKLEEVRSAPI